MLARPPPKNAGGTARVDAWLWAVRLYKTRSLATAACRAGHVHVNGDRVKAAQPVRIGDEMRVRVAGLERILVVRSSSIDLSGKRGFARFPMRSTKRPF